MPTSPAPQSSEDITRGSSLIHLTPAPVQPDLLAEPDPNNTDDFPTVITPTPRESLPSSLTPGARLGHFELMEAIGTGGMATVIKARDLDLGRIVALKILPPTTARDSEAVARFKLEARAAAKLDHENIARVYYCGEDCGLYFIAFEFVEGENLRQMMDRVGRLKPSTAIRYMLHLASGLAHAAERGVVHRDVKPSNILITPDGRAKIVDMGLARHLEGQSVNGGVTQSGVTLGTFDYISPEQALDPRRADIRSDIYSLGCAFYHALTGRPPVPEGTAAKKLQAHQHDQPTDPRDLNPDVGDGLALVLARMMAKQPSQRYASPAELIDDLMAISASYQSGSAVTVPATLAASHPLNPISLTWLIVIAVAIVAVTVYWNRSGLTDSTVQPPWQEPTAQRQTPTPGIPKTRPAVSTSPSVVHLTDARGIADAIAKQGDQVVISLRPGAVYDLTTLSAGIVFEGSEITFEPELDRSDRPDAPRPILRLSAVENAVDESPARPGTLTIRNAERVIFRGIELVLVDRSTTEQREDDPIGLLLQNVGRTELENCLVHAAADSRKGRLVGIDVSRTARGKTGSVMIRRSMVDLGPSSIGLRVVERTEVDLSEVGFGPHLSAVLWTDDPLESDSEFDPKPTLSIQSSTFMIDRDGSAITVGARAMGGAVFSACVFADTLPSEDRIAMPGTEPRPALPVVVRRDDLSEVDRFTILEGTTVNAVYRVTPPSGSTRFLTLNNTPWNHVEPRTLLTMAQPWDAFQLNLNEKKLRVGGVPHLLGVTTRQLLDRSTRPIYDGAWPPSKPQLPVVAKANQRVVHPDAGPEDANAQIYPTVAKAFEDLKAGETLLIAQNGRVAVSVLPERTLRATIMAYDGFTPILEASDESFRRPDASLFPLVDGELTFQNLNFHLSGRPAIVTMAGGTTCSFKNCVIVLDEKDDETISAILLTEPTREMKMTMGESEVPRIRFENSLIYGRGKAVMLRAPRSFEWTAEQSAFALDGVLLHSEAAQRDDPLPRATIRWKNVTSLSLSHQWEIRGSASRSLSLDVVADRCLLASAQRRRTLPAFIQLGNGEGMIDPAAAITWKSEGQTIYGNFDPLVEIRSDAADRMLNWDSDRWLRATGDSGRIGVVRFGMSFPTTKLRKLNPDDLKAEMETGEVGIWRTIEVGADIAKLPRPVEEKPRS